MTVRNTGPRGQSQPRAAHPQTCPTLLIGSSFFWSPLGLGRATDRTTHTLGLRTIAMPSLHQRSVGFAIVSSGKAPNGRQSHRRDTALS